AFAARLPFKVFDDVGDVGAAAVDARFFERARQNAAGRSDERMAGQIFVVARLLADEHHIGFSLAFSEYGLRAFAPEIACTTSLRRGLQRSKRQTRWNRRSEEHTSELQSRGHLVCRLLLEKKKPPHSTKATWK